MAYALLTLISFWLLWKLQQPVAAPLPKSPHRMDDAQAREVLGVSADASAEEIQQAYHSLIKKLHPDTGGSDHLTQLVIAAKRKLDHE